MQSISACFAKFSCHIISIISLWRLNLHLADGGYLGCKIGRRMESEIVECGGNRDYPKYQLSLTLILVTHAQTFNRSLDQFVLQSSLVSMAWLKM